MLSTILAAFSTVLSTVALAVACLSLRKRTSPVRRIHALELESAEQADALDRLVKRFTRLQARISMQKARESATVDDPPKGNGFDTTQQPGESAADWKARMRQQIAEGKISGR